MHHIDTALFGASVVMQPATVKSCMKQSQNSTATSTGTMQRKGLPAMLKKEIEIGGTYIAKISGQLVQVKLTEINRFGGWNGVNLKTDRTVRIRSAAKLRRRVL